MRLAVFASFIAMAAAPTARAAGFLIAEQGARATGRAAAFTAAPDDGSAIFYNPAGVATLKGIQAYVGFNLIAPKVELTELSSGTTTPADDKTFVVPNAYLTFAVNDVVSAGIGVNAPFGLGIDWPDDSPGLEVVRSVKLTTVFISPVLAVDLDQWLPGLSAGAGLDVVPAAIFLDQDVRFGSAVGQARLSGEALGFGGRVGLSYRAPMVPGLAAGVAWRTPVKLAFAGTADIDFDSVPVFRSELPPDGRVTTDLILPHALSFGVAYDVLPALNVEVDANWVGWSSYDALVFEFADGSTSRSAKDWSDTWVVRAGMELTLGRFALRGGYAYDRSPVPDSTLDPTLPDGHRHIGTLGVGAKLAGGFFVDAALLYVFPLRRTTGDAPYQPKIKGTYELSALVAGLSVGLILDEAPPTVPQPDAIETP